MCISTCNYCYVHRLCLRTPSLSPTTASVSIRRTPAPIRAFSGFDKRLVQSHISTVLTASLLVHDFVAPLLIPAPAKATAAATEAGQNASRVLDKRLVVVTDAPDLHAEAADVQRDQQWWQSDADAWLELTSPAELAAFMNSLQSAPAWPYLTSDTLVQKLKVVEFYATWCPACRAAAPGMAAVARDPLLQPTCIFARANADRVKPLLRSLGISQIPTALIISPEGQILDTVRATGQVVRDAVLQQAAALSKATAGRVPPPPAALAPPPEAVPPPSPEELMPSEVNGTAAAAEELQDSTSVVPGPPEATAPNSNSSSKADAACGLSPEPSCGRAKSGSAGNTSEAPASSAVSEPQVEEAVAPAALAAAKQQFLQQYGSQYGYGGWLEEQYQQEVGVRLGQGHHYLDYTGAALYPASLLQAVYTDLSLHTYGNPHSQPAAGGPAAADAAAADRIAPAAASETVLEVAALSVLQHMNADPAHYQVVFTRSATEALKLVGEMFPWSPDDGDGSSSKPSITSEVQMLKPSVSRQQQQQQQQQQVSAEWAGAEGSVTGSSRRSSASQFIYTRSNHNSVLGIGAYAAAAGADLTPFTDTQLDQWLKQQQQQQQVPGSAQQPSEAHKQQLVEDFDTGLHQAQQQQKSSASLDSTTHISSDTVRHHLVAFPAEDNFAGVIYPPEWVNQAHAASSPSDRYLVLLDAAAYLPTHTLDLTAHPADFVAVSFYKMFGYPTGLGALVLRTDVVPQLHKVYFGGGSVSLATPEGCWHVAKCDPGQALTDGTPNYLGAAALQYAYDDWDSRGGFKAVEQHTNALTTWLQQQLLPLHHSNGAPLLKIFGKHPQHTSQLHQEALSSNHDYHQETKLTELQSSFGQGPIFNFQVLRPDGTPLSYLKVDQEAAAAGLDLRSGCVCNPGACYDALGLRAEEVQGLAGRKEGCGDDMDVITVMRPDNAESSTSADAGHHEGPECIADNATCAEHQALVATQIPLGSVRASLGWASTFEDVYALVEFLKVYLA